MHPFSKIQIKRKTMQRVLAVLAVPVVLVVVFALVVSFFFQDKIKNIIVEELNKNLRSEIKVENIDLSLFRHFPYASLTFHNISALDATDHTKKDTLLKAERLNLNFNIIDILTDNYRLKAIDIEDAVLKLRIYNDNTDNFTFWNASEDTVTSPFRLELKKIRCNRVHVIYSDAVLNHKYDFDINSGTIKGRFNDAIFDAEADADISVKNIKIDALEFLQSKDVSLALKLNVDNDKSEYTIRNGRLCLGNMCFNVDGIVTNKEETFTDMVVTGIDISLADFINEWPEQYKQAMAVYDSKGQIALEVKINGQLSSNATPLIQIKVDMKNGSLKYAKENIVMSGISFSGNYTNGKERNYATSAIKLNNFNASLPQGQISGHMSLEDFNRPLLNLEAKAVADLPELARFAGLDEVNISSGNLNMDVLFNGRMATSNTFTPEDFINSTCHGRAVITNAAFTETKSMRVWKNINGTFQFNNNDVIIDNLALESGKSDMSLKGYFRNALSYIFIPGQKLYIEAGLDSKNLFMDEFLSATGSPSDTLYSFGLPEHINWNLDADIGSFAFGKFKADKMYGIIKLNNRILTANNIFFEAFDGTVNASGTIDARLSNNIIVKSKVKFGNTDINAMFKQLNNFGQNELVDKNIKGRLKTELDIIFSCNDKLSIDPSSIYTFADITIENGELIDYAPMKELSRFIKVNDLSHIRFETLKNKIEIKNRTIHIPNMVIKSSALNIEALGTHTFDNVIDYRIKLLLSEVLGKKARLAKKENEEFGTIEDDGLGKTTLFIKITGSVDAPVVGYDTKGMFDKNKNTVKEDIKSTFDKIGDELFRKNDTIVTGIETEKQKEKKKRRKENEIPDDFKLE